MLKASIPALFALQIVAARTLLDANLRRLRRLAIAALLLVGSATAAVEYGAHVQAMIESRALVRIPALADVRTLAELHVIYQEETRGRPRGMEFTGFLCQYIGQPSRLLFRAPTGEE